MAAEQGGSTMADCPTVEGSQTRLTAQLAAQDPADVADQDGSDIRAF